MHPETLLTRYLAEHLTHFHQTYINDALWNRDECVTIWGQKVKGHGAITYYAGTHTVQAEAYNRLVLYFLVSYRCVVCRVE